jgi:hypothetical protein
MQLSMDVSNARSYLNRFEQSISLIDQTLMNGLNKLILSLEMVGEISKTDIQFLSQITHGHIHESSLIEQDNSRRNYAMFSSGHGVFDKNSTSVLISFLN